ncbi:RNA polymerase sigma factor [Rhabdothermincola salaria]|uniref:RNA polymerase sigma factor n=1 Tax=Rhabdothermincola salaria TaxID=2903142 RepID=UPI001E3AB5F1|nr:hypothetical protein [Rhabdothermincola salaria]MCD9625284.1 hypothetical protein [Rhabdothermincola salaria]
MDDRRQTLTEATDEPFSIQLERWFASPEALATAKRLLRGAQGPIRAEDVVQDAFLKVAILRREGRIDDEALAGRRVASYGCTVMKRLIADVFRGRRKPDVELDERMGLAPPDGDDEIPSEGDTPTLDALRTIVETRGHEAWATSGALTCLTLAAYPACDTGGAPLPQGGARPDQARLWPCLWFAGQRDGIFPDADGGSAAQRQRLSRRARRITTLVDEATALHFASSGT